MQPSLDVEPIVSIGGAGLVRRQRGAQVHLAGSKEESFSACTWQVALNCVPYSAGRIERKLRPLTAWRRAT